MEQAYIQDKSFEKIDFKGKPFHKGEYENCTFHYCDFSSVNLSECKFMGCEFIGCNLSLAKLVKTSFQDIKFKDCKMLGLHFDTCSEFGLSFSFENCTLDHSSFYKIKIKKTLFINSQCVEVDFTASDLSDSVFENCDLREATFSDTLLEKVDFRTAVNYSIDPASNKIKKAKFSLSGLPGLLEMHAIEISLD